jgi:hypothetical protein
MTINFSICITYFYKRNNIFDLLNKLNIEKNKDIEILVSNDNFKESLNLKCHPRIRVFQNKGKPLGEIRNIKFLLKKAKGKYISIIADDDLIHHSIFELIKKNCFQNTSYLCDTTINKNNFGHKGLYINTSIENKINKFLEGKIYLSGTIAAVYDKIFITNIFKNIKINKYLLDTYLLFKILDSTNICFDYNYGFNNTNTSEISSSKIDKRIFFHDYLEVIKVIYDKEILLEKFILFSLLQYYSIVHREDKFRINYFCQFLKLNFNIRRLNFNFKLKLLIYGNYYLLKLILKAVKFF